MLTVVACWIDAIGFGKRKEGRQALVELSKLTADVWPPLCVVVRVVGAAGVGVGVRNLAYVRRLLVIIELAEIILYLRKRHKIKVTARSVL